MVREHIGRLLSIFTKKVVLLDRSELQCYTQILWAGVSNTGNKISLEPGAGNPRGDVRCKGITGKQVPAEILVHPLPIPVPLFPQASGRQGQARSSARWVYNENPTESIVFCAMRNAARSTVKPPRTALEYISLLSDQHNFFFSPSINTDNYIFTLLLKERKELTSLHKQFT